MSIQGSPRIEAKALDLDLYRNLSGGKFVVERRSREREWMQVGTFRTLHEAGDFIDGEVGQGHGTLHDYEIEHIPARATTWLAWLGVGVVGVLAVVLVLFLATSGR